MAGLKNYIIHLCTKHIKFSKMLTFNVWTWVIFCRKIDVFSNSSKLLYSHHRMLNLLFPFLVWQSMEVASAQILIQPTFSWVGMEGCQYLRCSSVVKTRNGIHQEWTTPLIQETKLSRRQIKVSVTMIMLSVSLLVTLDPGFTRRGP